MTSFSKGPAISHKTKAFHYSKSNLPSLEHIYRDRYCHLCHYTSKQVAPGTRKHRQASK